MKMKKCLISIVALILPMTSNAVMLKATRGTVMIQGVRIARSATVSSEGRVYKLRLAGAGLRSRQVAFLEFGVYVAEVFMDEPENFVKTQGGALPSLDRQKAIAIRFTFLRDVTGKEMRDAFTEGLAYNGVYYKSGPVRELLNAMERGEVKQGSTVNILAERLANGMEQISFENGQRRVAAVRGEPGLVRAIFSIWFGRVRDPGIRALRDQILAPSL